MDRKEINGHFANCVGLIKSNLEHWEIEQGWYFIGCREPLPTTIADKIQGIVDEYTEDNDLPDDWCSDYEVEDYFMEIDNN